MIMLFPMNAGGGGSTLEVLYNSTSNSYPFSYTFLEEYDKVVVSFYGEYNVGSSTTIANASLYLNGTYITDYTVQKSYGYCAYFEVILDNIHTGDVISAYAPSNVAQIRIQYLTVCSVKQTGGGGTVDPPALVPTTLWTNSRSDK